MERINFKASNFKGDCWIDKEFEHYLIKMNVVLIKHNMMCIVISSGRKDAKVKGAIVPPAKKSNHMVYHAIDCNLVHIPTSTWYNSTKLGDGTGLDDACCQDIVKETGLRWGKAFNNPDSVHFDDALNIKNPMLWNQKYKELHQ